MEETLLDIIELLDMDYVVYLHRDTRELLNHPVIGDVFDAELEYLRDEVLDIVDMRPDDFIRFEPPASREKFVWMGAFAATIEPAASRELLEESLRARKPFRAFRDTLENLHLEDNWYLFQDASMLIYVKDVLSREGFTATE